MRLPDAVTPTLWGVVGGAAAVALAGFVWGGWMTRSQAEAMAQDQTQTALVNALMPGCVARFEALPDASSQWSTLKKTDEYSQNDFLRKLGVVLPPDSKISSDTSDMVASACAVKLVGMASLPVKSASASSATPPAKPKG